MVKLSAMTNQIQNEQAPIESGDQLILYLDFRYALLCRACGSKVLDPDKKRGQLYFKGKCPTCHQQSVAPQQERQGKSTKRQRKAERREQRRAAKQAQAKPKS